VRLASRGLDVRDDDVLALFEQKNVCFAFRCRQERTHTQFLREALVKDLSYRQVPETRSSRAGGVAADVISSQPAPATGCGRQRSDGRVALNSSAGRHGRRQGSRDLHHQNDIRAPSNEGIAPRFTHRTYVSQMLCDAARV